MPTGKKIRQARVRKKLSQERLGATVGVSREAVSQWEKEKTMPTVSNLRAVARALGVSFDWLTDDRITADCENFPPRSHIQVDLRRVPVLTLEQVGLVGLTLDVADVHVEANFVTVDDGVGSRSFAYRLIDDSMGPEFKSASVVVFDPDADYAPGDFVFAKLDGDARPVFRQYRLFGDEDDGTPIIDLAPLNANYPSKRIDKKSPGRVIARLVRQIKSY